MEIGIVLGAVLLVLALLALVHRPGRRTYAMTKRMPLPYNALHCVEDAQAKLRSCARLLEELRNTGQLSTDQREKLSTAAWYMTEARLRLSSVRKEE